MSSRLTSALEKIKSINPWTLALVFVISNLILKAATMIHNSYGLDESWHLWYSIRPMDRLIAEALNDPNPPLFNLLLGGWIKLVGLTEATPRLFSVILSSFTAGMVFFGGKKLGGTISGILAALFFTLSSVQVFYGQEVRSYSLECLLVSASLLVLFNLFDQPGKKWFIWLCVLNVLIIYSHLTPVFLFVVEGVFGLVLFARKQRQLGLFLVIAAIAPVLAFIPWYLVNDYFQGSKPHSWIPFPNFDEFDYVMEELYNGTWGKFLLLTVMVVCLSLFKKIRITHLFLISVIVASIGLNLLATDYVGIFLTRYLIYTQIVAVLLLAVFPQLFPKPIVQGTVAMAALLIWFTGYSMYVPKLENWKELSDDLKSLQIQHPNNAVIYSPGFAGCPLSIYYNRDIYTNSDNYTESLKEFRLYSIVTLEEENPQLWNKKDIYVLSAHDGADGPAKIAKMLSDRGYQQKDTAAHYIDGTIVHFQRQKLETKQFEMPALTASSEEFLSFTSWDLTPSFEINKISTTVELTGTENVSMVYSVEKGPVTLLYKSSPVVPSKTSTFELIIPDSLLLDEYLVKAYIYNPKREKQSVKRVLHEVTINK